MRIKRKMNAGAEIPDRSRARSPDIPAPMIMKNRVPKMHRSERKVFFMGGLVEITGKSGPR